MKQKLARQRMRLIVSAVGLFFLAACQKEIATADALNGQSAEMTNPSSGSQVTEVVLLAIDEESIDNGNPPNNFYETDVNDQIARIGQRQTLRYFRENVGDTIDVFSGEVGDEGWHSLSTIPITWMNAGPTAKGAQNYLLAGPGLGSGNDGLENLLDKIPGVMPLRASGLKMLTGKTVLAVVYDGDVSINYGPLSGSLKGENLGLVALEVVKVTRRTDGSSGSLPRISVKIISVEAAKAARLKLFGNAPVPGSSSEPFDINPPAIVPAIILTDAR